MTNNQHFSSELVLASGVAYFSEDFNALPQVVNALTTRSSTMDILKGDANAVDRSLAKMLDRGAEALISSTASLSSVSNEFEASRAKVRDLRRRVGASMASFSGRRRDLNGLSFRKTQLEHALSILENIQVCLRACHGPISEFVGNDAETLKKAQYLFVNQLEGKLAEDVSHILQARLQERKVGVCKLLRGRVLDSVSARGQLDDDIVNTLGHLRDLNVLNETAADAGRVDLRKLAPTRQQSSSFVKIMSSIRCEFLSFPNMDSIEQIVGFVQALIQWGDVLMERSLNFTSGMQAIQKTCNHLIETWEFVQEKIEKDLRPLLDAFASGSSSLQSSSMATIAKVSSSVKNDFNQRPRHYIRKRKDEKDVEEEADDEVNGKIDKASTTLKATATEHQMKFESSPYHLAFIAFSLREFCQRHDTAPTGGRLYKFMKATCETSLRSVVNRDAASLFQLTLGSKSSEFVRSANRLQAVVNELRIRVLEKIGDLCDSKILLLDISHPFLHACRQRIDVAVDALASAWIARGGAQLVNMIRSDPLFIAIEARRNGHPPPGRQMLMEAAFDHFRNHAVSRGNAIDSESDAMQRTTNSQLSLLIALHSALHRVALTVLSKDEKSEFVSVADYALISARADVVLRMEFCIARFNAQQTDLGEFIQNVCSFVRHVRLLVEFWVESPAVLDFLFFPLIYRISHFLSRFIVQRKEIGIVSHHFFSLRSAFGAALVDASDDPFGDLTIFDSLDHALNAVRAKTDKTMHYFVNDYEAKDFNKSMIVSAPSWHHLFTHEEFNEM